MINADDDDDNDGGDVDSFGGCDDAFISFL